CQQQTGRPSGTVLGEQQPRRGGPQRLRCAVDVGASGDLLPADPPEQPPVPGAGAATCRRGADGQIGGIGDQPTAPEQAPGLVLRQQMGADAAFLGEQVRAVAGPEIDAVLQLVI